MTRRTFLALLPTTPIAAPAAILSVATAPWRAVEWWSKPFDWGHSLGVAVRVRNMLTGETTRHAVRALIGGRRTVTSAEMVSRTVLGSWIDDLNTGMGQGPSWLGRWLARRRA